MPRSVDKRVPQAASVVLLLLVVALVVASGLLASASPATVASAMSGMPSQASVQGESATPAPRPTPSDDPASEPARQAATPVPPRTAPPAPVDVIPPDSIAAVTSAGDGLRVRSEPGVGEGSRKLEPLLPRDTRMFVVDGPVAANGLDWYQVLVNPRDQNLFGWVAAGNDAEQWIERVDPECYDTDTHVVLIPAIEYVACFGGEPIHTTLAFIEGLGPLSEGNTAEGFLCGELAEPDRCQATNDWLQVPNYQVYLGGDESSWITAEVAMPWEWDGVLRDLVPVPVTGGRDAPEARECRVVDRETGRDLIPRAEAITRCRMAFVVREVDGQR